MTESGILRQLALLNVQRTELERQLAEIYAARPTWQEQRDKWLKAFTSVENSD